MGANPCPSSVAYSRRFGLTSLTSLASRWTEADAGGLSGLVRSWCHMAIKYWSTWPGGPISACCAILHNRSRGLPPWERPWKVGTGWERCSLVTSNSVCSGYSRIRRASLLERWAWAELAGTSSQGSLRGAHGSSTRPGGHPGKTGSVRRSPGHGSSPSPHSPGLRGPPAPLKPFLPQSLVA